MNMNRAMIILKSCFSNILLEKAFENDFSDKNTDNEKS